MDGIAAAQKSRLAPAKVNAVLVRGINDDEVEAFAEFARETGVIMRFIEFMPLDADRHWTRDFVVPAAEVHQRIHARWPLEQIPHERSETARKYRFADGAPGEIGLIAPVTQPFCGHCSRIRLTADGKLRTCLFSKDDHDLRALLREGASDEDLVTYISSIVMEKEEGHRINEPGFAPPIQSSGPGAADVGADVKSGPTQHGHRRGQRRPDGQIRRPGDRCAKRNKGDACNQCLKFHRVPLLIAPSTHDWRPPR